MGNLSDILDNAQQVRLFLTVYDTLKTKLTCNETDLEATKAWKNLEIKINENLTQMEAVVKHLNDITSYSMVNLERNVKNLAIRHAPAVVPEESCTFPISMLPRNRNLDFYGRHENLERIDHYLDYRLVLMWRSIIRHFKSLRLAPGWYKCSWSLIETITVFGPIQSTAGVALERQILRYSTHTQTRPNSTLFSGSSAKHRFHYAKVLRIQQCNSTFLALIEMVGLQALENVFTLTRFMPPRRKSISGT